MSAETKRYSGILLHPSSLPGQYGIGDFGPSANAWIDRLVRARQSVWQILPLGPTGYGDSPYQSFSAFAGNINLISPELLKRDGLISVHDLSGLYFPEDRTDYSRVNSFKLDLLRRSWENFRAGQISSLREPFELFCTEQRDWLDDYALFMALKDARRGSSWTTWPRELMRRECESKHLEFTRRELSEEIGLHQFGQFLFNRQWRALREYANSHGIRIIGDVPIFVAADSADVWANPKLYLLDAAMRPKVVAGVPPDYFSKTGQLWGNPLYDWKAMRETDYRWWVSRMRRALEMVDLIRIDHFRGFCAAWHIPFGEKTAEVGEWVDGPGADLFIHLQAELDGLPLIAEDLGEITPDVYELRDRFHLPGMKVLQFAFDGPGNPFLPHNYNTTNFVVYTGTHDNDTTIGWYRAAPDHERAFLRRYLGKPFEEEVSWDLIRMAWGSVASMAIAPLQDILGLGAEDRMNMPGRAEGNWQWRMHEGAFSDAVVERLAELTETFGRASAQTK